MSDPVRGVGPGYSKSEVEKDTDALELEMDVSEEILKQERYSAD
jgi:hypothetical protein